MYRKRVLPVILKAVNTARLNFHVHVCNRQYVQSPSECKTKESDDYKPYVYSQHIFREGV